jgi:hypothetical protein
VGTLLSCCTTAAVGHDVVAVEAELGQLDADMRMLVDDLVKAAQLTGYATRSSTLIANESARLFWDKHIGDAREVPVAQVQYSDETVANRDVWDFGWGSLTGPRRPPISLLVHVA